MDFLADIPANKGAVLEFEKESDGKCEEKGVSVTQTGQGLCVDTGCVTFTERIIPRIYLKHLMMEENIIPLTNINVV